MLYIDFRQHVLEVLAAQLGPQGLAKADFAAVNVEATREEAHGDLATNAAMVLAKKLAVPVPPRTLAEALVPALADHPAVRKVEIAGPGFINFFLHTAAMARQGRDAARQGPAYARLHAGDGRKALVEYVSINPTGPIHVGHGRNAVFGDAIANLLEKAGREVWREYLVNDAGGQIRVLVKSLHTRYLQLFGRDAAVPENGYPGEYLIDIARQLKERDGDKWLDVADEAALMEGLRVFAVEACLGLIKTDVARMGIRFDRYFSEYEMHHATTRMDEVVALLRRQGLVYEGTLPPPKGKGVQDYVPAPLTLFKATAFGLPEDQAVYNRGGAPTYFGQDIAYHYDKLQRGYALLVTVIGADQAGAFKPLAKAIEALTGRDDIYHPVAYEMVKVLRDGQPVKLSKRAGNIVLLSEVLEEVGTDAFRFTMLTVKPTTTLTFDLAKAVEKSMDNPVFYVQYAHARLCSVERQRQDLGIAPLPEGKEAEPAHVSPAARSVLREVMLYPAVIDQAARALEPHRLTVYATQLAAAIHHWYGAEKWLDARDVAATHTRLAVALAARAVLCDVLRVCGVNAPESM